MKFEKIRKRFIVNLKKIKKRIKKDKKAFSWSGLLLISFVLFLGILFVYQEKTGRFDRYFEKKYPQITSQKKSNKTYHIGFVSDAHAKFSKSTASIKLESKTPMLNFISEMNKNFHPDFVVDGGDFIDGTRRFGEKSRLDYLSFSKIFQTIEAPKYRVIGNHELRGMTRENWVKFNNYDKSYYYFDYDDLRVIVFDSTLISGAEENIPKVAECNEQLLWLEDLLKNSEGYRKIVFTHYPFIPLLRKAMPLEKIEEFNSLMEKYGVEAVFSGHVEVPFYQRIGGVEYFVIPGFFRSEAIGMIWRDSFSEITLGMKNKLKLFYKKEGATEYQTVIIPSKEFNEIRKEIFKNVNFLADTD